MTDQWTEFILKMCNTAAYRLTTKPATAVMSLDPNPKVLVFLKGGSMSLRLLRTAVLFLAVISSLVGSAFGHGGNDDPNIIHACKNDASKLVRIVDVMEACLNPEVPLHWSISTHLMAGAGIVISGANSNFTITNIGDTNPADDITSLAAGAGISVSGSGNSRSITNTGDTDPADDLTVLTSPGSIDISGSGNSRTLGVKVASCGAGSSIRQINADGTVVCEADDTATPLTIGTDCINPLQIRPGSDLRNCDLSNREIGTFVESLAHSDLSGANLSGSTINAQLRGVNLQNAKLRLSRALNAPGANLRNADLQDAEPCDLAAADLRGVNLTYARLGPPILGCSFHGADFRGANIFFASLSGADLSEADLSFASLGGSNFSETNLTGARIISAKGGPNFFRTNLSNANLTGTDLTGSSLDSVVWSNTTCPDGSNSNDNDGDGLSCLNNLCPRLPCAAP